MFRLALLGFTALLASAAGAHDTSVAHEEIGWTLTPSILLPVVASLLLYAVGMLRLLRRSRLGREVLWRRSAWFASGWLTLAAAVLSPLHAAGERSFTLHMLEHELLMLVATPLLVLSAPLEVMLWAFGAGARRVLGSVVRSSGVRTGWQVLQGAVLVTVLQAVALWAWHTPQLFELALRHEGWHIVQHVSFVVTALLFWSAMLRGRSPAGLAALCLFLTSLIGGALGALMTFARSPWYSQYAALGLMPFGLTPQEDQQLAGLLMWIPGGLVHAGVALVIFRRLITVRGESTLAVPEQAV